MNPEIKKLWIDALLSGEYQQGQGYLHQIRDGESQFCCLGVLCDLALKNGVSLHVSQRDEWVTEFNNSSESLPEAVMEWSGMTSVNGGFHYTVSHRWEDLDGFIHDEQEEMEQSLAELNDNGYTFEEIAKDIEYYF